MNYIIEFEIAALGLELMLLVIYCIRNNFPCATNKFYFAMLSCGIVATSFSLISVYTLAHICDLPLWINFFTNMVYLFAYNGAALLFFFYVLHVTNDEKTIQRGKILFYAGSVIVISLIATTPLTGWIINFKNNTYNHGPLFIVLYIVSVCMLLGVLFLFIKFKYKLDKMQAFSIMGLDVATIGVVILQEFFRELLLQNFVISLFFVLVYFSLQNPDDYIDKTANCFNSSAFYETAGIYLKRKSTFCIIAFTLDDFQSINRLLGIQTGDEVINNIAAYLQSLFGKPRVYHLTGCRYAIIIDTKTTLSADEVIDVINVYFSEPYKVNDMEIPLTPCFCVLDYPIFDFTTEDINDVLEYSFHEMKQNRDITVITATDDSLKEKRRELQIIDIMKKAIRNESFQVYYQPIYNIKTGTFTSAEALIRLFDDELGFISPDEFIPMAEENGMIIKIGELVFRNVCRFLKENDTKKLGLEYVEINLSAIQCMQDSLSTQLTEIMQEYGISASSLNFEITETANSLNEYALRKNMRDLINKGASFSMDDYGTGFATANYLITLPMSIVKIDKSILWPAMENPEALIILRHTVKMLKALNKMIVVEGVETENMRDLLIEMGVDYLQGYLYSKPVPEDRFIQFLTDAAV
ncbi:MAG: EAL domain-containing protein [Clostridium sp.]|nr:EAL domain-containing protein [Clostridium sp.]MCM1400262.1 EAL domain-containing protein [Clostridium sp.]MCM1460975.1 EAL domain-containing protein [Bacteroides sp.]